ncbi:MAG: DUF4340 domain-containing protein [bacterium]
MTRYIVTGVLIAVFAALIAYVKLYEKGEVPEEGEERPIPVLSIEKEQIRRLEWRYAGENVICSRSDKLWQIDEPEGIRPDQEKLDAVLDDIEGFEATRELGGKLNPADFGLDEPEFRLEIGLDRGESIAILAGDESPTEGKTYIALENTKRVLLTDTWRVNQIKKEADDLRDKSVVKFDRDKVKAVTAESGGEAARCRKNKKGEWKLDGRKKSCDSEASAIMSTLKYADALEFVAPDDADDRMGPEEKISVLKLELVGNKYRTIALGEREDNNLYINNKERNEVYRISDTLAKDVEKLLELTGEQDEEKKEIEDGTAEAPPDQGGS